MLNHDVKNNSKFGRNLTKNAAMGLAAFVLFGAQVVAAQTGRTKVDPRAMQAHFEMAHQLPRSCVPVNGAQILGGFVGPDDLIDINTGDICGKR